MRHDVQNGELVVPAGKYFVLGDNRTTAAIAATGLLSRDNVVGLPFSFTFSCMSLGNRSQYAPG